jgi:rhodanese-related sulfurtransferase
MKNVTVREALQEMEAGKAYVDVRSEPEFEDGHPAGAINVPLLHLDPRTGQMTPNREFLAVMQANFAPDARLLLGCRVGGRSAQAAQLLEMVGYRDVANVTGGFSGAVDPMTGRKAEGWEEAGLPVERGLPADRSYPALRQKAEGR